MQLNHTGTLEERSNTILIVDDDYLMLRLGREVLGLYGYDVITAISEEEALQIHASSEKRIALVILDHKLKGEKRGLEIAKLLRSRDPAIKTIVASDSSHQNETPDQLVSEVDVYLTKPYAMHTLANEVQRLLPRGVEGIG